MIDTQQSLLTGVDTSYVEQLPPWLTFDQFGRYSMLRETLAAARKALNQPRFSILDVGGFTKTIFWEDALPILHFLPDDDVLVVDQAECSLPHYQRGDGTRLDFANNAFDFVTTADTFEHIPADQRAAFVDELLRVARYGVVMVAPFKQPVVDAAEELLFAYIKVELGVVQQQLAEHRGYGLPDLQATKAQLAALNIPCHSYPSGYIHSWLLMMVAKHYLFGLVDDPAIHMRVDQYYIRWLAQTERREPSYRHCIVAAKDNQSDWLSQVDAAIQATLVHNGASTPDEWRQAVNWLVDLVALKPIKQQAVSGQPESQPDQTLAQTVANQQQQIDELLRMVQQRDAALADLQARLNWQQEQMHTTQRQLERVANGTVMRLLNRLTRSG